MEEKILNSLLKEYDYKKLKAEIELDNRKENLYNKLPRLKQIEDELNTFALQTAKNILHNDKSSLSDLYEVKVASNGEMAIKMVDVFIPDIILLDIVLPDKDGSYSYYLNKIF